MVDFSPYFAPSRFGVNINIFPTFFGIAWLKPRGHRGDREILLRLSVRLPGYTLAKPLSHSSRLALAKDFYAPVFTDLLNSRSARGFPPANRPARYSGRDFVFILFGRDPRSTKVRALLREPSQMLD
jgi:hypothetical protein